MAAQPCKHLPISWLGLHKLTQSSENVPLCICKGLSLFVCDGLGQFFLKQDSQSESFIRPHQQRECERDRGDLNKLRRWFRSLSVITEVKQLHFQPSEPLPYNVIFDELLIAQEELLPSQDGRLWPGAIGSWTRVHSSQHLLLRGFGDAVDHFICGLQGQKRKNIWDLVCT